MFNNKVKCSIRSTWFLFTFWWAFGFFFSFRNVKKTVAQLVLEVHRFYFIFFVGHFNCNYWRKVFFFPRWKSLFSRSPTRKTCEKWNHTNSQQSNCFRIRRDSNCIIDRKYLCNDWKQNYHHHGHKDTANAGKLILIFFYFLSFFVFLLEQTTFTTKLDSHITFLFLRIFFFYFSTLFYQSNDFLVYELKVW